MSEGENIVPIGSIKVEPKTEVRVGEVNEKLMGGEYIHPGASMENMHIIRVEELTEASRLVQQIDALVSDVDKSLGENSIFIENLDKEKVNKRLNSIRERLINEEGYRKNFQALLVSHELAHKQSETRFGTSSVVDIGEDLNAFFESEELEENWDAIQSYFVSRTSVAVYDEVSATISGIKNAKVVDEEVAVDNVFLNYALHLDELRTDEKVGKAYDLVRKGQLFGIPPGHLFSDVVMATGRADLIEEIKDGRISKDDFIEISKNAMSRGVLAPESVLQDVKQSEGLVKAVDVNFMKSISETKRFGDALVDNRKKS